MTRLRPSYQAWLDAATPARPPDLARVGARSPRRLGRAVVPLAAGALVVASVVVVRHGGPKRTELEPPARRGTSIEIERTDEPRTPGIRIHVVVREET